MDPETARLMVEHEVDGDVAEKAQELIDDGLDEDEAVEAADCGYSWRLFYLPS